METDHISRRKTTKERQPADRADKPLIRSVNDRFVPPNNSNRLTAYVCYVYGAGIVYPHHQRL